MQWKPQYILNNSEPFFLDYCTCKNKRFFYQHNSSFCLFSFFSVEMAAIYIDISHISIYMYIYIYTEDYLHHMTVKVLYLFCFVDPSNLLLTHSHHFTFYTTMHWKIYFHTNILWWITRDAVVCTDVQSTQLYFFSFCPICYGTCLWMYSK